MTTQVRNHVNSETESLLSEVKRDVSVRSILFLVHLEYSLVSLNTRTPTLQHQHSNTQIPTPTQVHMENLLKEVAAKAVVPASPPPETNSTEATVDIQTELRLLVERSDFQNALWKALSEQKKELVLYVCKLITSTGKMPRDLSQPVCSSDICSVLCVSFKNTSFTI